VKNKINFQVVSVSRFELGVGMLTSQGTPWTNSLRALRNVSVLENVHDNAIMAGRQGLPDLENVYDNLENVYDNAIRDA
jgi:hypothetical protein